MKFDIDTSTDCGRHLLGLALKRESQPYDTPDEIVGRLAFALRNGADYAGVVVDGALGGGVPWVWHGLTDADPAQASDLASRRVATVYVTHYKTAGCVVEKLSEARTARTAA